MLKLSEIRMRDPYILPYNGVYYLYGRVTHAPEERYLYVYRSTDLENWEEPVPVFTIEEDSWYSTEMWAPEVHIYKSKFYMFITILGKHGLRGTQIAVCDTPDGTFVPLMKRSATPLEQSCIDGTLYVENDVPYIVYSHDWPDNYIKDKGYYLGEIWAVQVSEDLKEQKGIPFRLFTSLESPISATKAAIQPWGEGMVSRYGTDAPFLNLLSDGRLLLTWSPIPGMNYVVVGAISESGSIRGPWKHYDKTIFDKDGGHAMFFDDFNGQKKMCIHCPNTKPNEHILLLDVIEKDGSYEIIN